MSGLWMRWIDFSKLRDMFVLIAEHDGALRAKDIHNLGVQEAVLVTQKGTPFTLTTTYHYRKTLERLDLVYTSDGRYFVNRDNGVVVAILRVAKKGGQLSESERLNFATLVVQNRACYEHFIRAFLPENLVPLDVNQFVNLGGAVRVLSGMDVSTPKGTEAVVSLQNLNTGFRLESRGENAVQAILWGLRLWAIDQLGFLDEILSTETGYTLYPVNIKKSGDPETTASLLVKLINSSGEWATLRVPDFILLAGQKYKLSAEMTKEGLSWLYRRYPNLIAAIASSEQFIVTRAHSAQRRALLNSYIQLTTGEYVSHFQVHKSIHDFVH
jgi:hypothetical protein